MKFIDGEYEHGGDASKNTANINLSRQTPAQDGLRQKLITTLEDYFKHTLELRLDEDIPNCADDLLALITAATTEARLDELQKMDSCPPILVHVSIADRIKELTAAVPQEGHDE